MKECSTKKTAPEAAGATHTLSEERTSMPEFISRYKWHHVFCVLFLALGQMPSYAQSRADSLSQQSSATDQAIPPAIARELEAMRRRIDELEAQLNAQKTQGQPAMVNAAFPVKEAAGPEADPAAPTGLRD